MFSKFINQCRTPKAPENQYDPKPVWGTEQVDGQALSLFRIIFSLVLLYDLFFNILPAWEFIFSADGVLMAAELGRTTLWSPFSYADNKIFHAALLILYGSSLTTFLIGYKPRKSAFIACLLMASLIDKNNAAHSSAELLASLLLLWSAFLPTGRYWSVEAALNNDPKEKRTRPWPIIPVLAIKLQITVIYLYAGLYKLDSPDWIDGTALQHLSFEQLFARQSLGEVVNLISPDMQYLMTWGVILFQLAFTLMIYTPIFRNTLRALAIIGAAAMHLGFIIFLQIHMFPYICFCYLILLLPNNWFNKVLQKRRARLSKIRIYYDPDCGFCRSTALIFREFCLGPTATVEPASNDKTANTLLQKHNSWVVFGADEQTYLKWQAVAYIMKQSPFFWIFGAVTSLSVFHRPMEILYDLIGNNRGRLSTISAPLLKPMPERYPERMVQYICLFFMSITFTYATFRLPQIEYPMPKHIEKAASYLGLYQAWDLFVGEHINSSLFEINAKATDHNNQTIDLRPYLNKIYTRTEKGHYLFKDHRTMRFIGAMFPYNNPRHREGFARYLCHQTAKDGLHLKTINLDLQEISGIGAYDPYQVTNTYNCANILKIKETPKTLF